jgi:hypothetical protein
MKFNCIRFSDAVEYYEFDVQPNIEYYDGLFLCKHDIFDENYIGKIKAHLLEIRIKIFNHKHKNADFYDILYSRMMRLFDINLSYDDYLYNHKYAIAPRIRYTHLSLQVRKNAFVSHNTIEIRYNRFINDIIDELEYQYQLIKNLITDDVSKINTFKHNYIYGYSRV